MANARRIEKINILIREVVSAILYRDLSSPEGIMVTVTRVETSEDIHYATIFISVFGGEEDQEKNIITELSRSAGLIQHQLNRKLRMRPVPKITFAIDREEKRRERIEKLLSDEAGNR